MTVAALNSQSLDELRAVIDEMTSNAVLLTQYRDSLAAMGVPPPFLMRWVNRLIDEGRGREQGLSPGFWHGLQRTNTQRVWDEKGITDNALGMVQIESTLRQLRDKSKQYDVDVFVVNKLVEFRQKCPVDKGEGLLMELLDLAGLAPTDSTSSPSDYSEQRSDEIGERTGLPWGQYLWDVALGVSFGIGAILLLN